MRWIERLQEKLEKLFGSVEDPVPQPVADRFEEALALTLSDDVSVGFFDHPDRGGVTMSGVTQKTYDEWRANRQFDLRPVRESSQNERTLIAKSYWDAAHCKALPRRLAIVHFDTAFNHHWMQAIRFLQSALSVKVDGLWGGETMSAVHRIGDESKAIRDYLAIRSAFYAGMLVSDPTQKDLIEAWMKRIELLREKLGA